ncbi:hypothetical protein J6590_072416 [Homalodisca vitripennis]|nr:hypothetical protein J6590_072416 [Homalodisca vitripennis]
MEGLMCVRTIDGFSWSIFSNQPLRDLVRKRDMGAEVCNATSEPRHVRYPVLGKRNGPRGTGAGAFPPRIYILLTIPGHSLPHDAQADPCMDTFALKWKDWSSPKLPPSVSPFMRNSKLSRIPSPTPSAVTPKHMASVENIEMETPKPRPKVEHRVSPDQKNVELARKTMEAELKKMSGVLNKRVAAIWQKNISMNVKNGMCSLEESMDVIDSTWKLWKILLRRLT